MMYARLLAMRSALGGTSTLAVGLAAASLLGAAANGCSFLIDFPEEGSGAGPLGGGPLGGGGGGEVCEDFAANPTLEKTTWRSEMRAPDEDDDIATTGLARYGDQLYAFGRTKDGLADLFTGSSTDVRELYLVRIPDQGPATLAMGATACNYSDGGLAGRITALSDGSIVVSGMLGIDPVFPAPGTWSFALGDTPVCSPGTSAPLLSPVEEFGGDPFFAKIEAANIFTNVPQVGSDGLGLDVDQRKKFITAIGVVKGQAFNATFTNLDHRYFVQRSTEMSGDTTYVLEDHFHDYHQTARFGEAGVAVDEDGNGWFGGGSCDDAATCGDQGAFFGVLPPDEAPELIVERPGTPSAITVVRFADDRLVFGGRYDGTLSMLGATLPPASSTDAFVMVMARDNREILWTYPGTTAEPGYERIGFNVVTDLAVMGDRDCGAVYVLGCTVPGGGSAAECVVPLGGKRGFIAKLDFTTARELWVDDIALENPNYDFFLPTAMTAQGNRLWLAATVNGQVAVAGTQIEGAAPQETLVLELSP